MRLYTHVLENMIQIRYKDDGFLIAKTHSHTSHQQSRGELCKGTMHPAVKGLGPSAKTMYLNWFKPAP